MHAFAKHPSGSRPGAPGARLPSDVVELDPAAPKPDGPACLRAQAANPGNQGAAAPHGDLQQTLPANDPGPHGGPVPPERPTGPRHREEGTNRGTPGEGPQPREVARAEGGPATAGRGEDGTALREARGHTDPIGARQVGEERRCPRGVCALMGLGRGAGAPVDQGDPPPKAQPGGGPARPRTVHAQTKPALSRVRKAKKLPGPSGRRATPGATSSAGLCPARRPAAFLASTAPHQGMGLRSAPWAAPAHPRAAARAHGRSPAASPRSQVVRRTPP